MKEEVPGSMRSRIVTWMMIAAMAVAVFGFTQAAVSGPPPMPISEVSGPSPTPTAGGSELSTPPAPMSGGSKLLPPPIESARFEGYRSQRDWSIPTLTQEQKAKAKEIALSDARVQELLADREYEVGGAGVIHSRDVLLGVHVTIYFNEIHHIVYDWPRACYPPGMDLREGKPTYSTFTVRAAGEVTQLTIEVDLEDGLVKEIVPYDTSRWKFEKEGESSDA